MNYLPTPRFRKTSKLEIKNIINKVSNFEFRISNFLFVSKRQKGFSLIELLVTISIFVVITGIVLVKNSSFNSSVRLTNLVYEVGLKIREAQTYGVSVREFGVGTARFDVGYGVYFDDALPNAFVFFGDEDRDRSYDGGVELIDSLSMVGGNTIARFCATPVSGPVVCSDVGAINNLTIVFERPRPEAIILTDIGGVYQRAEIVLTSVDGQERSVEIDATGQISVKK